MLEYQKRKGQLPDRLLHALAALIVFYKGEWNGEEIPLNDGADVMEFFQKAWQHTNASEVVKAVLANESFWGQDLTEISGFSEAVTAHVNNILKAK